MKKLSPIFYFGNPLWEKDNLSFKLIPFLKKTFPNLNFIYLDPNENFPLQEEFWIIDNIKGISTTTLLSENDLEKLTDSPRYSAHDFDLVFCLKLYQKLGKIKKIKIIAVPWDMKVSKAVQQVKKIINKNFPITS